MKCLSTNPALVRELVIGEIVQVDGEQFVVEGNNFVDYEPEKIWLTTTDSRVHEYNMQYDTGKYRTYRECIRHLRKMVGGSAFGGAAMMTREELCEVLTTKNYVIDSWPRSCGSCIISNDGGEALSSHQTEMLLSLVHDAMDEAGRKNDDERHSELAHIARKLGDGQNEQATRTG